MYIYSTVSNKLTREPISQKVSSSCIVCTTVSTENAKMLHLGNSPNQETKIPRYLAVQIQIEISI